MSVNDKGCEKIQQGNRGDWGEFFSEQRVWGTTPVNGDLAGKASAAEELTEWPGRRECVGEDVSGSS